MYQYVSVCCTEMFLPIQTDNFSSIMLLSICSYLSKLNDCHFRGRFLSTPNWQILTIWWITFLGYLMPNFLNKYLRKSLHLVLFLRRIHYVSSLDLCHNNSINCFVLDMHTSAMAFYQLLILFHFLALQVVVISYSTIALLFVGKH